MSTALAHQHLIYRVGDLVRIVEPRIVVRVGYPLTKTDAMEAAEKEYAEKVHEFMRSLGSLGLEHETQLFGAALPEYDGKLYNDLLSALASYWIRSKGFGGKERKIYTEVNETLRDTSKWRVLSKRRVKTGIYCAGGYSGGWDGEPDYDPPYLRDEQTHVLLTLGADSKPVVWSHGEILGVVEIEAVNVVPYAN